jgi:hypothetical protein
MRRYNTYLRDAKNGKVAVAPCISFRIRPTMNLQQPVGEVISLRPMSKKMIFKRDRDNVMQDARDYPEMRGMKPITWWAYGDKKNQSKDRMSKAIVKTQLNRNGFMR